MIYRKIDISFAVMSRVSEDTAKEFIDHRVLKKSPLTQRAFDRAMTVAGQCQTLKISPDEAVELVISMGWQGVVFENIRNELNRRQRNGTYISNGNNSSPQTRSERADNQLLTIVSRGNQGQNR